MELFVLSKYQVLRLGVLHWCEKNETRDRLITVAAHEKYNRCCGAKTQRAQSLAVVPSDEPSEMVTEMLGRWQVSKFHYKF